MPEGDPRPVRNRSAQDRRERLLNELAQHLRDAADCVEALAEPDDDA
jgi:hypothetical protein